MKRPKLLFPNSAAGSPTDLDIKVVSPAEWRTARIALLEKEKELTRRNDALAAERRALPIVEISKDYRFTTLDASGKEISASLSDLFAGRRQLIIYHFMFEPASDAGCVGCSHMGDHLIALEHMHARDTTIVCVSRAPIEKLAAYQKRMGWTFPWYSSYGTDFNYDFHVTMDPAVAPVEYNYRSEAQLKERGLAYNIKGEQPGISCFFKGGANGIGEAGKIYHTYSAYARGLERHDFLGWMDLTKLGRQDKSAKDARKDEYTPDDLKGSA
jgi:predicted dithiol-disulfide oxidoreductase (DUF899 family)